MSPLRPLRVREGGLKSRCREEIPPPDPLRGSTSPSRGEVKLSVVRRGRHFPSSALTASQSGGGGCARNFLARCTRIAEGGSAAAIGESASTQPAKSRRRQHANACP